MHDSMDEIPAIDPTQIYIYIYNTVRNIEPKYFYKNVLDMFIKIQVFFYRNALAMFIQIHLKMCQLMRIAMTSLVAGTFY